MRPLEEALFQSDKAGLSSLRNNFSLPMSGSTKTQSLGGIDCYEVDTETTVKKLATYEQFWCRILPQMRHVLRAR